MTPLPAAEVQVIADVIAGQAAVSGDPGEYFRDLIGRADLPPAWRWKILGLRGDDLGISARKLVRWAVVRGLNPADRRYTTLGSLLVPLLDDIGSDIAAEVVAVIVARRLYAAPDVFDDLVARYQAPQPWLSPSIADVAPAAEDVELQSLATGTPRLLDVGSLATGIRRAASVCRVEGGGRLGTGFLVGPGLVMTAAHVALERPTRLRFRCTSAAEGTVVAVRAEPWLPVAGLDVAVVRLDGPAPADAAPLDVAEAPMPRPRDSLAILQHPDGGPMRLALTANGVADVDAGRHFIRYATTTQGGSSGAPCFDGAWRVVALHRLERATFFGAVREGVLISSLASKLGGIP